MKRLSMVEMKRRAQRAKLLVESWPDGTIAVGPPDRWMMFVVPVSDARPLSLRVPKWTRLTMVTREKSLPQCGIKHRCSEVRGDELEPLLRMMLKTGACVNDDAYLFNDDGSLMMYVSHHDELLVYMSCRK